jgi:hypothetical protein
MAILLPPTQILYSQTLVQNCLSSESVLLYDWRFTANHFVLVPSPLSPTTTSFFQPNICGYIPHVTSSAMRGWVCRLQLLPTIASAVILGCESRGTDDHILLSQMRDSPTWRARSPVFISLRNSEAQLYPQALDSLFVASNDSQGYGGGIRTRLHTGMPKLRRRPLLKKSRHGPHRKHSSSILAFLSVAARTCLPSRCPETAVVYPPISQSSHSNGSTCYTVKHIYRILLHSRCTTCVSVLYCM